MKKLMHHRFQKLPKSYLAIAARLFAFVSIWLYAVSLFGQTPEILFESANKSYAEGDYGSAIIQYQKILDQGIESGEVYFNLGNAFYKQNEVGRAILYYEKARKYLEGDTGLEQNLQLAELRVIDEIEEIPKLFLEEWWYDLTHLVSMKVLLWLTFIMFSLVTVVIIIQLFMNRRFLMKIIWTSLTLFSIVLIITVGQIYEFETSKFGVILEEKVSVLSSPDLDATEVFILHEGTKVQINRERGDWLEITIPDGKTGWMKSTDLGLI